MPQTTQIVPKYSFPYTETVINNNTIWDDTDDTAANVDTAHRYLAVFTSEKGVDNKLVPISTVKELQNSFGKSNYKKYGQPLMTAYAIKAQQNTSLYAMRIMPNDAFYANAVLSLWYKLDKENKKIYIKFTQKSIEKPADVSWNDLKDELINLASKYDGPTVDGAAYQDAAGFTQVPLMVFTSTGRGVYGNNYRWRINLNTDYEKNYGFKLYTFQCLDIENGTDVKANYVGSLVTSTKISDASFINDVIEDNDDPNVPMDIHVFEENAEAFYDVYKNFWEEVLKDDPDYVIDSDIYVDTIPDMDCFDMLFGKDVSMMKTRVAKSLPFINYVSEKTAETPSDVYETRYVTKDGDYYLADGSHFTKDGDADVAGNISTEALTAKINSEDENEKVSETSVKIKDIDENLYSTDPVVVLNDIAGNDLLNGSDGSFDMSNPNRDSAIEAAYIAAFNGQYDSLILSPRRIPASALFDANFTMPVKAALARLALFRNDALLYLDTGFMDSLSLSTITNLEKDFSAVDKLRDEFEVFSNYLISYNLHDYKVKEDSTGKRVPVTITYFLASIHASHLDQYGYWVPMVNEKCQLSGHIRNSLKPTVDLYEKDLKEILYNDRFNYFEAIAENTYQRATQSTSDAETTSDLTEENNVQTLMYLKRSVEDDVRSQSYVWTDAESRADFASFIKAKYRTMIGKQIYSLDVKYSMNKFEFNRSITHVYLAVKFRKLTKQTIVEIDVNKQTFDENEGIV